MIEFGTNSMHKLQLVKTFKQEFQNIQKIMKNANN